MHFLQGMSRRRLQAHVSQKVKYHCMAQLRVSFPEDLVPVAKHWWKTKLSTNWEPLYYAASGLGELRIIFP